MQYCNDANTVDDDTDKQQWRVIAKFHYTDPTRTGPDTDPTGPERTRTDFFCGETPLGPCGSGRVRVVEFSFYWSYTRIIRFYALNRVYINEICVNSRCAVTHCWFSSHLIDTTRICGAGFVYRSSVFFFQMSVRLSDPSIDSICRRVCCWAPHGQQINRQQAPALSSKRGECDADSRRTSPNTDLFCFMYSYRNGQTFPVL